jgi:hypothetical protein
MLFYSLGSDFTLIQLPTSPKFYSIPLSRILFQLIFDCGSLIWVVIELCYYPFLLINEINVNDSCHFTLNEE